MTTYPSALLPAVGPLTGTALVSQTNAWLDALRTCGASDTAPEAPTNGMLWLDTSNATTGPVLKQRISGAWTSIFGHPGAVLDDFDTAVTNGPFRWQSATANAPVSSANGSGYVFRRTGGITQLAFRQNTSETDLIHVRISLDDTGTSWAPWRRVYTEADILGTVSLSESIPTGAVIETALVGSARYIRWADGNQLCWGTVTLVRISTSVLEAVVTFPIAFVNDSWSGKVHIRSVSITPGRSEVGQLFTGDTRSATQWEIDLVRILGMTNFDVSDTVVVEWSALGRWA